MSNTDLVLALFRGSHGRLVGIAEIGKVKKDGSTMFSYTERISNARKRLDCKCGQDPKMCTASEHIVNVKTGWYQYRSTKQQTKQDEIPLLTFEQPKIDLEELQNQIEIETDPFKKELLKAKAIAARGLVESQTFSNQVMEALI